MALNGPDQQATSDAVMSEMVTPSYRNAASQRQHSILVTAAAVRKLAWYWPQAPTVREAGARFAIRFPQVQLTRLG
jgi:hypothetical protein